MILLRRQIALLFAVGALGVAVSVPLAIAKKSKRESATQMDERQRALHALNRLAFGPRPGDVKRVVAMGVDKWIDHNSTRTRLKTTLSMPALSIRTLRMNTREIAENFPPPR